MLKKYKVTIIITSLVTILPVFIGLLLWDRLPDQVPIHWNISGEVDDYAGKGFAVLVLPLLMLAVHLICTVVTSLDPKSKNISGRMFNMVLWICPLISLILNTMVFAIALGIAIDVNIIISLIIGIMFIAVGIFMPKFRHNYTIGIKLPWTLHDEGNWNATHRVAGPLWIAGGILVILSSLITSPVINTFVMMAAILIIVLVPLVYSYLYYRRNA